MRKLAALILCALILCPAVLVYAAPQVSAGGACLLEASTGRVLYAQNADVKLPMASTTKIMTAILAIESCDISETVAVDDKAVGTEGSSMYLRYEERITVEDLLFGLMLTSGNDAAVALAIHICGSVEDFAILMNEKAAELGCENTNFVTPNGLHHDDHYSTAYDMALIAAYAMQNADFKRIVGTTYHETESGSISRTLKNKNKLLWEYEGGNGVKTGYTTRSGRCLVFSASRDGLQLVGAVINCPDMWNAAKGMLDFGFENYEMAMLVNAETQRFVIEIENGTKKALEVAPEHSIMYPVRKSGEDLVELSFTCEESLCAPVSFGLEVGEIGVSVNGEPVRSCRLITIEGAERLDFWYYLREVLQSWFAA